VGSHQFGTLKSMGSHKFGTLKAWVVTNFPLVHGHFIVPTTNTTICREQRSAGYRSLQSVWNRHFKVKAPANIDFDSGSAVF